MRVETGGTGIGKLKARKTRNKVFARVRELRGAGKEYREEIQSAVAGALASASWRRDVGLSDCTVGGEAGRRPWNFYVNKISGSVYLSSARRAMPDAKRERKEEGRKEGGREEARRSLFARVASCLDTSPTSRFTRRLRRNDVCDILCVCVYT